MSRFIEHSDDWAWQPPIPPRAYRGWWISNDDGDPINGPFATRGEAQEELAPDVSDGEKVTQ